MAYVLRRSDSLIEELRDVALEQIDVAVDAVEDTARPVATRVHRVRRCCKRIRGALRLVEPGLRPRIDREDKFLRKAARRLANYRDAQVLLDIHKELAAGLPVADANPLAPLGDQLCRAVAVLECGETVNAALAQSATDLEVVWERAAKWRLKGKNASRVVSSGYGLTYQRALDGRREAYKSRDARAFHRWRTQVKYHQFHASLLESAWLLALAARAQAAEELGDCLGRANDLTVYTDHLATVDIPPATLNPLIARGLTERNRLWVKAERLGERLFHQPPKAMRKGMARLWRGSEITEVDDPF